jgi:hypothetical protein
MDGTDERGVRRVACAPGGVSFIVSSQASYSRFGIREGETIEWVGEVPYRRETRSSCSYT